MHYQRSFFFPQYPKRYHISSRSGLLKFNTLRGTKTTFLTQKRYNKHPCPFICGILLQGVPRAQQEHLSSLARAGQTANLSQTSHCEPTLEKWLDKWNKRQKKNESTETSGTPTPPPPQPSVLTPFHLVFLLFKNSLLPCYHRRQVGTRNYQELTGVNGADKEGESAENHALEFPNYVSLFLFSLIIVI